MKLATFNIFWLGNDEFVSKKGSDGKERTEADWLLIARVISRLDADVIAFQEIVSLEELQKVFDLAVTHNLTSRSYRIHDQQGVMLGAGGAGPQKVVLAYDENQCELVAASQIAGGVPRLPFGVRVRNKSDGGQVLVIGVHFKSGQPFFDDVPSADKRKKQCQHLADWAAGLKENGNPVFPKPAADELIVILGDFNALYELEPNHPSEWALIVESLKPLRDGHMNEWWWQKPLSDPAGGGRTTSYVERLLIDFVMLSPSLKNRIIQQPTIYAYDQDAEITNNFATEVAYRVSDHRPVHLEIDVSPA